MYITLILLIFLLLILSLREKYINFGISDKSYMYEPSKTMMFQQKKS